MQQFDAINHKSSRLFVFLAGFFVANTMIAEFIGVKIFSLERSLGFQPLDMTIFGIDHLSFSLTCGVLLWPFVFVMTDIINEYYGIKGVRMLSLMTVGLITYAFLMFFIGINLAPADFWIGLKQDKGIANYNDAFGAVFGQGNNIILGSIVAFLIAQFLDVFIFHKIKEMTGERNIWLRATGSTIISQLVDSFVVLYIAFHLGAGLSMKWVLAVMTVNYIYKFLVALLMTPVIYAVHGIIERYLGDELATEMKQRAMGSGK
ncbi:MAG: queuosine precursor transporter [Chitinophagales bacterium]|nr:queuosine precursor transporter [Chitinophagales bacterium]